MKNIKLFSIMLVFYVAGCLFRAEDIAVLRQRKIHQQFHRIIR